MDKVYKVVRHFEGKKLSAICLPNSSEPLPKAMNRYCLLEYNVKMITVPKIGYIFAFTSIADAANFIQQHTIGDEHSIWEAKGGIVATDPYMACNREDVLAFWGGIDIRFREKAPPGTVYVKTLELIKHVWRK